jgi:DNA-binding response OmpR family regulator
MSGMTHARVLIADGDRRFRSQIHTRLVDVDVFCDCVSTASEALENLRDRRYGLVLLDLDLPNEESYVVIDELRLFASGERPMVLATASRNHQANVDPELVQIIMRKPLRLADVADMIRSCVGSVRAAHRVAGSDQRADRAIEVRSGDQDGVGIVT